MIMARCWKLLASAAIAAMATPALAQDAATVARIEAMQAQIDAMQKQLAELKALAATRPTAPEATAVAAAAPAPAAAKPSTPPVQVAWKGAPEFSAEGGWRFKPRGRIQFDAASVSNPNGNIPTANLGFNSRSRRLLFGAEGDVPGGFKWRAEFDFAQAGVGYEDVTFQYAPKGKALSAQFGYFYPFSSLETVSSSGAHSFFERAQMTDAFAHNRRIGAAVGYTGLDGDLRVNAGVFNDSINASFDNDDWLFGARATWSPEALGGRLHLGANYQHREFQSNALNLQYRARPFVQTTDIRFVDTGLVAARGDDVYGVEAAGIFGPFHVAGEAQWVKTDAIANPATLTGIASIAGGTSFAGDPSFFSYYAEAGWWLTGETRGYRDGAWARTSVKKGFDKGGWGAVGVNLRYDYLDLRDRVATGTPATRFAAPNFVNGGTQAGYLVSLIWQPIDYVRFMAQYTRTEVEGGPRAAVVVPGSTAPLPDRDYSADVVAVRAQFDF